MVASMGARSPFPGKKPSPIRPARRAAASEWPPMMIGTVPLAGFGLEETVSNETNSPSKDTSSPLHRVRIAPMYSSVRAPRRSHGTPRASNSSRSQPTPIPNSTRPPLSASRVATSLARTTGLRSGRMRIPVPSRMVEVWAATQVSQISGSVRGVSGVIGIRPLSS